MIFILFTVLPVNGQASDYSVHLRRNFGFGGGSNIRGTFTISLVGEKQPVESVVFLIDNEPMAAVSDPPFTFRFETDDYGFGLHRLYAEVTLSNGSVQTTPVIQYRFIGPDEMREQVLTIVGGIVAAIAIALVVVAAVQDLFIRKGKPKVRRQPGEPRQYGILGGTICPRCGRPFPRHIWGMNFMVGKLDRCENCGKWVMTVRATSEALQAAEEAEMDMIKSDQVHYSPDDESSDLIENTKFFDEV
mgnify:CR=1 FL=1